MELLKTFLLAVGTVVLANSIYDFCKWLYGKWRK